MVGLSKKVVLAVGATLKDFSFLTADETLTGPETKTILSRTLTFEAGDYLIRAIMQISLSKAGYCESRVTVDGTIKSYSGRISNVADVDALPLVNSAKVTLSAGPHTIALVAYLETAGITMTVTGETAIHVTVLEIWEVG